MPSALQSHAAAFKAQAKGSGGEDYVFNSQSFIGVVSSYEEKPPPGKASRAAPPASRFSFRYVPADLDAPLKAGDYVDNSAGSVRVRIGPKRSSPANPVAIHDCETHEIP